MNGFNDRLNYAQFSINKLLDSGFKMFEKIKVKMSDNQMVECDAFEFTERFKLLEITDILKTRKEFEDHCKLTFVMGTRLKGSTLFSVANDYPELKTMQFLGMMMEYAFPDPKHSYLNPRPLSCFEKFMFLPSVEQIKLCADFKKNMQNFDNVMIVDSVVYALRSFKIDNIIPVVIYPDFKKEKPLKDLLMSQLESKNNDFIIMALPTNQNRHSVAVVINTQRKELFYYDSEGNQFGGQSEAFDKLKELIQKEERFADYTIPEIKVDIQQKDKESCGIFSVINIIAYILHECGVKSDVSGPCRMVMQTLCLNILSDNPRKIKPKTNSQYFNIYLGGLLLAKQEAELVSLPAAKSRLAP